MYVSEIKIYMKKILKYLSDTTIKIKIILIFSFITILLAGTLALVSYVASRDIYRRQVQEEARLLSSIIAADLENKYLDFIQPDRQNLAYKHFHKLIKGSMQKMNLSGAFIFNRDLDIYVSVLPNISKSRLQINRKEITELKPGSGAATLPFKADDGNWYLWAFHRLDENWYFGVQENVERLARLDELAFIFLFIGIGGVAVTILAAWLLARSIARPIDKLVNFSRRIGGGFFNEQPPKGINGELKILQNAFIEMRSDLARQHKEKENMLAQIAHEIRNPLGSIELLAGLLMEDIAADTESAKYTRNILSEVQGLKTQISDYLNYSRPMPAEPEQVDLAELYDEVKSSFEKAAAKKSIHFQFEPTERIIYFDRRHLRRIFINLIANSIDSLLQGGSIRISSANEGKRRVISFTDDGPGIEEEHLTKIFDPFYTTKKEGSGLGLSISRKLCYENKAALEVTNNPGKGCTFQIIMNGQANNVSEKNRILIE